MFSRLNLRLLAVFAILFAITHASLLNPERRENEIARRQGIVDDLLKSESSESTVATTKEPTQTTTSPSTTKITTPTSTSESSISTPTITSVSTSTPPTNTSPTPSKTSETESEKPTIVTTPPTTTKTTKTPDSEDVLTTVTSSTPTLVVVKSTVIIDGVPHETSGTVTSSVPVATTVTQKKGSESTGKGMSAATKRTVIGVVVGIIGAVVLGALFFLAWRIWGRRKNDEDDDDTLSPFGRGSSAHGQEKTSDVGSMPSPFKTTLDQYHNPNAKTNVSSNF